MFHLVKFPNIYCLFGCGNRTLFLGAPYQCAIHNSTPYMYMYVETDLSTEPTTRHVYRLKLCAGRAPPPPPTICGRRRRILFTGPPPPIVCWRAADGIFAVYLFS